MKFIKILLLSLIFVVSVARAGINPPKDGAPLAPLKTNITIVVPESFLEPGDLDMWAQINVALRTDSNPDTTFTLEVQGEGGDALALNQTIAAIEYAKLRGSKIKMIVIGPAYSAHALLTCYADNLFLSPNGSLMFHDMKSWSQVGPFTVASDSGMDINMQVLENGMLNQCINSGVLSKNETIDVLNGKEVSILPDNSHVERPNRYGFMFTVDSFLLDSVTYIWYGTLLFGFMLSIFFGIRKGLGK